MKCSSNELIEHYTPRIHEHPPPPPQQQKQTKPAPPASPLPLPSPSPQKRRKRTNTADRLSDLPGGPGPEAAAADDEGVSLGSLDFDEILDEDVLRHKSTVVNRAPVMMAWACVVAERLGFTREEALSIGTHHVPSPPPPSPLSISNL